MRRPSSLPAGGLTPPPGAPAWRVGLSSYGVLENLTCFADARRAPDAGEVEIEVTHAALNFKDVMFALGLLREHTGLADAREQPLGLECSGHIVAVGPHGGAGAGPLPACHRRQGLAELFLGARQGVLDPYAGLVGQCKVLMWSGQLYMMRCARLGQVLHYLMAPQSYPSALSDQLSVPKRQLIGTGPAILEHPEQLITLLHYLLVALQPLEI